MEQVAMPLLGTIFLAFVVSTFVALGLTLYWAERQTRDMSKV
jgi:hypothetical protein